MCGIAGFCLSATERALDSKKLAKYLLLGIEERGMHATGAAWVQRTEDKSGWMTKIVKRPVTASQFVLRQLNGMPRRSRHCILHTRYATQGSPKRAVNNHPITSGDVVGVHNGVILNDNWLFRQLDCQRKGEVDSEAVFATLAHSDMRPEEALVQIEGSAALAWMDTNDVRNLHLARVGGRPLYVAQTENGSVVFASLKRYVTRAALATGLKIVWDWEVPDNTYVRVRDGVIVEQADIKRSVPTSSWLDDFDWDAITDGATDVSLFE